MGDEPLQALRQLGGSGPSVAVAIVSHDALDEGHGIEEDSPASRRSLGEDLVSAERPVGVFVRQAESRRGGLDLGRIELSIGIDVEKRQERVGEAFASLARWTGRKEGAVWTVQWLLSLRLSQCFTREKIAEEEGGSEKRGRASSSDSGVEAGTAWPSHGASGRVRRS